MSSQWKNIFQVSATLLLPAPCGVWLCLYGQPKEGRTTLHEDIGLYPTLQIQNLLETPPERTRISACEHFVASTGQHSGPVERAFAPGKDCLKDNYLAILAGQEKYLTEANESDSNFGRDSALTPKIFILDAAFLFSLGAVFVPLGVLVDMTPCILIWPGAVHFSFLVQPAGMTTGLLSCCAHDSLHNQYGRAAGNKNSINSLAATRCRWGFMNLLYKYMYFSLNYMKNIILWKLYMNTKNKYSMFDISLHTQEKGGQHHTFTDDVIELTVGPWSFLHERKKPT